MRLLELDRRIGAAVRRAVARAPGGPPAAAAVASALSPAFRAAVAAMLLRAGHRRAGADALAAGVVAATAARLLRDRLSRPRPGDRPGGGFPSRHGAAAVAIARAAWRREPRLGRALAGAAAVGLAARVAAAEHDPADVLAGAAVGLVAEQLVHVVCLDQYLSLRC
jgi:membrane-associated phospholipid phosphatase